MKQRVVYLAISLLATSSLTAQEVKKWTLNDCIEYALEKNIQLQQIGYALGLLFIIPLPVATG